MYSAVMAFSSLTERRKDGCKGTLGMTDVVGRGGPPGSACSKLQHWPIAKSNVSQSKEKTLPSLIRLGRVSHFFYKKLSPLGFAHNKVHCDIPASYSSSSSSSSSSSPSSLRKGCDRCRVHFAIRSGNFRCSAFNDRPELIQLYSSCILQLCPSRTRIHCKSCNAAFPHRTPLETMFLCVARSVEGRGREEAEKAGAGGKRQSGRT